MPAAMARQEGGIQYRSQTATHDIHQRKQTQSTALHAWPSQQGQAADNAALCPASAFSSSPESPEQHPVEKAVCKHRTTPLSLRPTGAHGYSLTKTAHPGHFRRNSEMPCLFLKGN